MKVRTIYVRPGDALRIRFVIDEECELNATGWKWDRTLQENEIALHHLQPSSFHVFPSVNITKGMQRPAKGAE
jgi:hypothetical protein